MYKWKDGEKYFIFCLPKSLWVILKFICDFPVKSPIQQI
jgi:hypothetical protein